MEGGRITRRTLGFHLTLGFSQSGLYEMTLSCPANKSRRHRRFSDPTPASEFVNCQKQLTVNPRIVWSGLSLFLFVVVILDSTGAWASPVTFITALPVSQDQLITRFNLNPILSSGDPSALNRNFVNLQFPTTFLYGVTGKLAVFLTVNQGVGVEREDTAEGRVTRSSSGFGDTLLFGRYTLIDVDHPASTFRIAPVLGAYLPSGCYNKSDHLGRLPGELQSGSGSVDPFVGLTESYYTKYHGISWDATYRHNPSASHGFALGDEARTDIQYEHLLDPWVIRSELPAHEIWFTIESNLIWDQKSRVASQTDNSSGGLSWLVDAGPEWATLNWEVGAVAEVPIIQHLYGQHRLSEDVGVIAFFEYYLAMPSWHR